MVPKVYPNTVAITTTGNALDYIEKFVELTVYGKSFLYIIDHTCSYRRFEHIQLRLVITESVVGITVWVPSSKKA